MKLCSYDAQGVTRVGLVVGDDRLADVTVAYAAYLDDQGDTHAYALADVLLPPSMLAIIEGGASSREALKRVADYVKAHSDRSGPRGEPIFRALKDVHLRAPVPRPPKILGPNWNHKTDQARIIRPPGEPHPFYSIKMSSSVTGPFDPIEIPDIGGVISEVEAAVIIGKKGKHIPADKAAEYIFGCTVANDLTALDMRDKLSWVMVKPPTGGELKRITTAARYKCLDTFCPMGPWLVTTDEVDIHNCRMQARVDGELDQIGSTADMVFNFYQLIAYFSAAHTLEPGDVILSATPALAPERKNAGLGKIDLADNKRVLESEIEGIGVIRNPIKYL
ncbi:MAG: fumarylacetoacetate hydrolase family protein [Burkholderiales bacterium]|nr:fumarylacetoacetate hydrolase family protein [Burkholderiales bacterium]